MGYFDFILRSPFAANLRYKSPMDPHKSASRKIVLVGSSCAGKTTLAKALAKTLGAKHIELDALFWEADWREAETEAFRQRVQDALASDCWVADGNYTNRIQDILWSQADTLLWLDPSLPKILFRFFSRSIRRSLSGEILWGTCKENLRNNIFRKNSLLVWILRTHKRHRRQFAHAVEYPPYPGLKTFHIRKEKDLAAFLATLPR